MVHEHIHWGLGGVGAITEDTRVIETSWGLGRDDGKVAQKRFTGGARSCSSCAPRFHALHLCLPPALGRKERRRLGGKSKHAPYGGGGGASHSLYTVQVQVGRWLGPMETSTYWRRLVPPLTCRKLLSCMRQSGKSGSTCVVRVGPDETLTVNGGLRGTSHRRWFVVGRK